MYISYRNVSEVEVGVFGMLNRWVLGGFGMLVSRWFSECMVGSYGFRNDS